MLTGRRRGGCLQVSYTARSWLFRLAFGLCAALALGGSFATDGDARETPAEPVREAAAYDARTAVRHVEVVLRRDAAHCTDADRALIRDEVVSAALQSDVDPLLVLALIRLESGFRTDVVSHNGALGLMQLQPATAHWIATRLLGSSFDAESSPLDVRTNIRLGVRYFSYLFHKFGSFALSLEAYNRGPNSPDLYSKSIDEAQLTDRFWPRVLAQYFQYRHLAACADDACSLDAPWGIGLAQHELTAFFSDSLLNEQIL